MAARLLASLLCLALGAPLVPAAGARAEEAHRLLDSTRAEDSARAARLYEARVAADPESFAARLGAAVALTQEMAIRTNGNLPLIDGLQDTEAHRALWSERAPRALEHARKAHALRPDSLEAAAALATSYMFYASSLGIIRSILSGAGGEYRTHAGRLVDLDPEFDDALGHSLLGNLFMVAPWPVGDDAKAREHLDRAAQLAPASARNQYTLGVYWARDGERARARQHFQRVVDMPCSGNTERLFCAWMKQASQGALADLAR